MDREKVIEDVLKLNKELCFNLWRVVAIGNKNIPITEKTPKLVIPPYRDDRIRISEQEARFLMCTILNNSEYFYSVETPTVQLYSFSNSKKEKDESKEKRSALLDLTLWSYNKQTFERIVNIEFKAHNPSKEHIIKDLEKLVKENILGNWFHLLQNIDSGTLKSLFQKLTEGFQEVLNEDRISLNNPIIFTFCVWEKRWACQKVLTPGEDIEKFFTLEYKISQGKVDVMNNCNWEIFEL